MSLIWKREKDGEHYGKPIYEYVAESEDRTYHVVWACDQGGTFGYTATRKDEHGRTEYLSTFSRVVHSITWARTLRSCKAACEAIEAKYKGEQDARVNHV